MFQRMGIVLIMLIGLTTAQTINLKGKISNKNGAAISNAIVTLVRQNLKDTTGSDGMYTITGTVVSAVEPIVPVMQSLALDNGILELNLSSPSTVKIDIFNVQGNLLRKEVLNNANAGVYHLNIAEITRTSNVLIVHTTIGDRVTTFRYLPLNRGKYILSEMTESTSGSKLTKAASIMDSLKVTASGFTTKTVAVSSYSGEQNITLDSSSTNGKNPPAPSSGCGKDIGALSVEKQNITSGGANRTYYIKIPKDYDKTKPYRLIFGMHCMGGSAEKVAGIVKDQSQDFYGIKPQAEKDGIQCIYVAPQGDAGGTWNPSKDPQFFFDIQKDLKEKLCIDTTRVFSVGFSFGAMFSYALSLKYPNILRAVACNAPANYRFDPQPTNNHIPIAYVQTTGIVDGTCPWIFNESAKQGGKFCLLQHVKDNGCDTTTVIQLTTKGAAHKVTEFTKCKDGFPVKFISHNGDHYCNAKDPGSNVDFIPVEFWEFLKRF